MKSPIQKTLLMGAFLALSLLFDSTTSGQIPGVIGIKFGFTGGYSSLINLDPLDEAGVVAVTNWNNLLADVQAPQGTDERIAAINVTWPIPEDSAGNALPGVTLTPEGFNDGWNSGGTGCANGRLLFNVWKFNDSNSLIDDNGKHYAAFTIANLPGATYDVYLYINNNNGNYWGNARANSVLAIGSNIDVHGFNGANSDPCPLNPQLHTAAGFGNPANYVKMPAVATEPGGVITVTVVMIGGGHFGVAGVQLVPSANIILKQDTLPDYAETVVGDQVVFSAAFSNSPAVDLQWERISGGATNVVNTGVVNVTNNGVVTSTLTLDSVQVADSGVYRLKATEAGNVSEFAYSAGSTLVVGSTPAAINNVIVKYAAQNGVNFYPPWTIDTDSDLILNFQPTASGPGTSTPGEGNFGLDNTWGDPAILSDGIPGSGIDFKNTLVSAGPGGASGVPAGRSMTYTLNLDSAPNGYDVTNIMVFGGWPDGGRNQQKFNVKYSTVSAPETFVPLLLVDYHPADPSGAQSATRTTLVPVGDALAYNVAAVQIDFNVAEWPENGWEGYSEIAIGGTPSMGVRPTLSQDISPLKAADVVGGTVILSAEFTGADSLQWQKNGTDIPGATGALLTLENLQLSDTATNGGYVLVASNAAGTTSSRAASVIVNPTPTAIDNAVTAYASQSSDSSIFAPTWDASILASSLIKGVLPSDFGVGDFTGAFNNEFASGPEVLTDGTFGVNDFPLSGNDFFATLIGSNPNAGNFVTYMLTGSEHGYDITNIVSVGSWQDAGRDQQAYTVYYATVADPSVFIPLTVVDFNPAGPGGTSFTRATITPVSGSLAVNVVALKFDMTSPAGENGYSGYSEIGVFGTPSGPYVTPTPPTVTASVVAEGNLIVTGTGGTPNRPFTWLTSTNISAPIEDWTISATGMLDNGGAFSNAIPVDASLPASFFRLLLH